MKIYRLRDIRHQTRMATSDDGKNFFALNGDISCREFNITNERIEVALAARAGRAARRSTASASITASTRRKPARKFPEHPIVFHEKPDRGAGSRTARSSCRATCAATRSTSRASWRVVIGYECKNVSRAEALNYVLGYTIANDVSARDWQKHWGGSQWCRGKTFDTFCPLGPGAGHARRHQEPERSRHPHARERRDDAGKQHARHDFSRRGNHRISQRQHDARAGHADPDRHAGRRRHGPQAAGLSQGRATSSKSRSRASASCAIR